jgi:hypothetical protein
MKQILSCSALCLAALAVTHTATAQERPTDFGDQGQLAVSAERLFGLVHSSTTTESDTAEAVSTAFTFALLGNPLSPLTTNYSTPRVALDYFVTRRFSIGGAVGFFSTSVGSETRVGGQVVTEGEDATLTGFTFAPRVGYAVNFNDAVGVWLRGGLTYLTVSSESGGSELSSNQLALTLEAPFYFEPVPHVAFTFGPTLDLGLSGSTEVGGGGFSQSRDVTGTDIGAQASLTVYY